MEDRLLAVLPIGHRLADLEQVPLVDLKDETFISLLAASDQDVRRVLESVGIRPKVKYKTKDDYAIISMVENGEIAIVMVDGEATCKKVVKHSDALVLVSNNTKYPPMFFTIRDMNEKNIAVLGRVIELRAKF